MTNGTSCQCPIQPSCHVKVEFISFQVLNCVLEGFGSGLLLSLVYSLLELIIVESVILEVWALGNHRPDQIRERALNVQCLHVDLGIGTTEE